MVRTDGGFDVVVVLVDLAGGGTQRVARRLVEGWASRGRAVLLVAPAADDGRWDGLPAGVAHEPLVGTVAPDAMVRARRVASQAFGVAGMARQVRRAVRRSGAPVVVSMLTGTNLLTLVGTAGLGVRRVVSERNDTVRQRMSVPVRTARRALYRFAEVVTANSQVGVDGMAGYVRRERLHVVPNDVVVPAVAAGPASGRVVLTVGRLAEQKEHVLLAEAFRRLDEPGRVDDWHLEIVGEGPMRPVLEAATEDQRSAGRVVLTGHLDDVGPAYLRAGIFVLPSRFEGTPNALLEAMAHGLPCVVSDSLPGAVEHVHDGETGLVFRSGDADDLAEKIARLVDDPRLRVELGERAREAMRALDRDTVLDQWDALLA